MPLQAAVRGKLGEETTAFLRVADGARAVAAGDVVRLNAKPAAVGRVLHFTIPQAVREEGAYANGRVHVELLPPEVYGAGCEKAISLRRLDGVLSEAEQQEHTQKELLKVGAAGGGRLGGRGFASCMQLALRGSRAAAPLHCLTSAPGLSPPPGGLLPAHRAHALCHGAGAGVWRRRYHPRVGNA